jgi:hypothetical protein
LAQETKTLRARVLSAVVPGLLGAAIGYAYARATLPDDLFRESSLPAMYTAGGAAIMILAVRLSAILRLIYAEIRGQHGAEHPRDQDDDGDDRASR